jgi:hypothetical protein
LTPEGREQLASWFVEHGESLPEPVRIALGHYGALLEALNGSGRKLSQVVCELRRALGVAPKTERRSSRDPLGPLSSGDGKRPKSLREKLKVNLLRLTRLSGWHRDLAARQVTNMNRIKDKLAGLPLEEIEPTAAERAEMEEETRRQMERYALGEKPDPALQSVAETLITGGQITTSEECVHLPAPEPEGEEVEVLTTRSEERVRYDFTLTVTRVVAEVEKKVVVGADGERRMLSATTAELGPPRYAVTWGFLTNLAVMVAQYAMPMHRMSNLLSTEDKRFTTSSLSRMLRYVGERFVPIYLQLFDELCDSEVLMGDDTPPRVLEVNRYFAQPNAKGPPPWHAYRTQEEAAALCNGPLPIGLEAVLAAELGFESMRRTGDGPKRSLNTTVVAGRSDAADPKSLRVFYRTHLGGLGNLLEMLLVKRNPSARSLTIQSDLATVNLVSDPTLLARFDIRQVGCASHARRPFALYEHEDPDMCGFMLHMFKGLFIHEHGLDLHGRNVENVKAIRGTDSRQMWEQIKWGAELVTQRWSAETKLGQGARYIVRHYDKLTAYLDDPRLAPTNNFSERMLRMEKLIEGGSMFRATLGGRFVLDILRSILQTAVAARAPLQEYVMSILRTPAEEIESAPEQFTPRAWARAYLEEVEKSAPDAPAP